MKKSDEIRCRGCRRLLGHSLSMHAGALCLRVGCYRMPLPPASVNEARDSLLEVLERELHNREAMAAVTGISVQRVYQIVLARRETAIAS